jgi:hypothetical protein
MSVMSSSEPHLAKSTPSNDASLDQLRAQLLERVGREHTPTRAQVARRQVVGTAVLVLIPALVFYLFGGVRASPRPPELVLETALGSAILAAGIAALGLRRGRSMLGRPRSWLIALVLLTPVALFTWRVLASSRYPDMMVQWVERPGLRCLLLSCSLSVAPLAGVLWMRRGQDPIQPHLSAAGMAAAIGAGTWVFVDLWCPVSYVPHLLLGHVLPLLLLITAGALVGGRLLSVRRST